MILFTTGYITAFVNVSAAATAEQPNTKTGIPEELRGSASVVAGLGARLGGSAHVYLNTTTTLYIPKSGRLEIQKLGGGGGGLSSSPTPEVSTNTTTLPPSVIVDIVPCTLFEYQPYIDTALQWDDVLERWYLTVSTRSSVHFENSSFRIRDYYYKFYSKNGRGIGVYELDKPIYTYRSSNRVGDIDAIIASEELGCAGWYEVYYDGELIETTEFRVMDYPVKCDGRLVYNFDTCCFEAVENIYDSQCYTQETKFNPDATYDGVTFHANTAPGMICINGVLQPKHTYTEPADVRNGSLQLGEFPYLPAPTSGYAVPSTAHEISPYMYVDFSMNMFLRAAIPNSIIDTSRMFRVFNLHNFVDASKVVIKDGVDNDLYDILFRSYIWVYIFEIPFAYITDKGGVRNSFFTSIYNVNGYILTNNLVAIDTNVVKEKLKNIDFMRWNWDYLYATNNIRPYQWMHVEVWRDAGNGGFNIGEDECPPMAFDLDSMDIRVNTSIHPYIALPPYIGTLDIAEDFYAYAAKLMYLTTDDAVRYGEFVGLLPNGSAI